MKKFVFLGTILLIFTAMICLTACGAAPGDRYKDGYMYSPGSFVGVESNDFSLDGEGNYIYDSVQEKGFFSQSENPASYFSLDRNTASYSLVRRQISDGYKVAPDSVRIEELINYFDYSFPQPQDNAVGLSSAMMTCPWNTANKLMMIGVKTEEIKKEYINSNYVFLIDVSGSMEGKSRLGLAKKAIAVLAESLTENDRVSVVTYASGTQLKLDGAVCDSTGIDKIKSVVNGLQAYGSTNGQGGLEKAYEAATKHFIEGGNNRVIMISDGDFNIGISDKGSMKEFIQDKAQTGVYLSVIGVGMGNTRDDLLETLALAGNGSYAYLDNETEAKKVFLNDLSGTLYTVAKDAKAGVVFSDNVEKYRLIGYDTKYMSAEDFENTEKDAGEIGSGLSLVVLYEVELKNDLQTEQIATVEVKYKDVRQDEEINSSVKIDVRADSPADANIEFAACVAEFGLILRNSEYKGNADLAAVISRLEEMSSEIADDEYKIEFVELVKKAKENY